MAYKKVCTGTGVSFSNDPEQAGTEAAGAAVTKLGTKPDFGFVFCSDKKYSGEDNVKKLVRSAHKVFMRANPKFKWVGCTTTHISGCVVFVASSKNIHVGIGVGASASKVPLIAGERAARQATSQIELDKHIEAYISSLAAEEHHPTDLSKIHPYLLTMLSPRNSKLKDVLKGVVNVTGPRAPVFKESGYTFSNGVLFKDAAILLLQAFDTANDWYKFQNKWLSSIFGPGSLIID